MSYDQHKREWMFLTAAWCVALVVWIVVGALDATAEGRMPDARLLVWVGQFPAYLAAYLIGGVLGGLAAERGW